jgi:hypothetical protein
MYTTFGEGELERELRRLSRKGGPVNDAPPGWRAERRHRFHHKWHECPVTFPDGSEGTCHYTRHGPACHGFRYERGKEHLPHVSVLEPLGKDAESIEELAQEKAAVAFGQAIAEERKGAMRAQPPWTGYGSRKADPALYTLSRERAVQLAGRYALCARLEPSGKLLAVSATFESLEAVNAAWREKGNPALVLAICCRWARRWMELRFNTARQE